MAVIRQTKTGSLFRVLVVPTMLLCGIFRKTIFQWVAAGAVVIWLAFVFWDMSRKFLVRHKRKKHELKLLELAESTIAQKGPEQSIPENDLFLIRQINYRITEQLKSTYPMVSWLWDKTPSVAELCRGGTWRIRVSNTEPFNYGEVTLAPSGNLKISMLQVIPLNEPVKPVSVSEDLKAEDLLDRVDVKTWYLSKGENVIAQMIDDLNAQGHRQLIVKESGEVCIMASGIEQPVNSIENFPPRLAWEEFKQLLSEDDIEATVMPNGLILAW